MVLLVWTGLYVKWTSLRTILLIGFGPEVEIPQFQRKGNDKMVENDFSISKISHLRKSFVMFRKNPI